MGKRKLAPNVSPSKTWEGLIGGVLSATVLGALLCPITPFNWWQAGLMSFIICIMGFFGGLVMSAIKRDAGVKDFGQLIEGHGGVMDRVDSLAFAAPWGELTAAAVALDAAIDVRSASGERTIPARSFFTGPNRTVLERGELIVRVRFPAPAARSGAGFHEVSVRYRDYCQLAAAAVG